MQKQKVLIIDDEVDFCMIMQSYFSKKNCEVTITYTLMEGMQALNNIKPDILFLDNNLPDGHGWEFVEEIVEKFPQLKIYLISAYRREKDFSNPFPNTTVWEKPLSIGILNSHFQ